MQKKLLSYINHYHFEKYLLIFLISFGRRYPESLVWSFAKYALNFEGEATIYAPHFSTVRTYTSENQDVGVALFTNKPKIH